MFLQSLLGRFADPCPLPPSFFGLPTWYKYLGGETDVVDPTKCVPKVDVLNNQAPLIGLAVLDMLLYVAGILVVVYMLYGAFLYMTSQGQPEKTAAAKTTLLNAIIGLLIVMMAITVVGFIGGRF